MRIPLIFATGYIDDATLKNIVPMFVLGVQPVNLMNITGAIFLRLTFGIPWLYIGWVIFVSY